EAFICDIPTPLKKMLAEHYEAIEVRLAAAIGEALDVELVLLEETVHQADRIMVVSERDTFTASPHTWGPEYERVVRYPNLTRMYANPHTAYQAFMLAWNK